MPESRPVPEYPWAKLCALNPATYASFAPEAEELEQDPLTRVTLFGPYDSGKSSLLKRLLVEGGCSIPEWLTVSARRETFEVESIEWFDLRLQDTPGLGGGAQSHSDTALQAAFGADVLLIVLPPQLITGEVDQIRSILQVYSEASEFASFRSLMFVISRVDEAGASPDDARDEFERRIQSKKQELAHLLDGLQIHVKPSSIFAVAADPYGMVGDLRTPSATFYDSGREWDGINSLVTTLKGLSRDRATLRESARRRIWRAALLDAGESLKVSLDEASEQLRVQTERERMFERAGEDMSECFADCRIRLNTQVVQQVESLVSSSITELEAVRPLLEQKLKVTLTA